MIDRDEIDAAAGELDIHTSHIQRDYIQGWVLAQVAQSDLAERLVLKGGTCFRKGYFPAARYSKDIDFSTQTEVPNEELLATMDQVSEAVADATGVEFQRDRLRVGVKRGIDGDKRVAEVRLYFRDFYGEQSKIVLSLRVDVTQFDKIHLPVQERHLIHQYSDADDCKAIVRCVQLEELLALKLRCLLQRQHIADLWDLAFPVLSGDLAIDRGTLLSTFFKATIFQASPRVAKALFLDLPLEGLRRFWTSYIITPANSRLVFDSARQALTDLINTLIPGDAVRDRSSILFCAHRS
jgi:predicted nucleotidyltransferase component of viral defense system